MNPFQNRRVAVRGKLGGMTLREAAKLVRALGGTWLPNEHERPEILILGAEALLESNQFDSAVADTVMTETELWQTLGMLESLDVRRRLYTPAMLAELLDCPVRQIRRWHRAGYIQPLRTVHRLPYFAFEEIAVAKRILELLATGESEETLRRRLNHWAERYPHVDRPLAQLDFVVHGRTWLSRRGDELLEASGQKRFDFTMDSDAEIESISLPIASRSATLPPSQAQLMAEAESCDEAGETASAAEYYRAALAIGPTAELCLLLADCLFRLGDLSAACERYSMAIELDDQHVEARANLGCVLVELQRYDWAEAALAGALALHPDYADAHLHLAQLLDLLGRSSEAEPHWRRFAALSADGPWADLAARRLGEAEPLPTGN